MDWTKYHEFLVMEPKASVPVMVCCQMREFYCYQAFNKFKTCPLETGDTQTDPENRKCVAGKVVRTVKGRCNVGHYC